MPDAARTHSTAATRAARTQYDRWRGSSASRGYGGRWRKYRAVFLREHPLCVACQRAGRLTAALHVDHITPVDGDSDPLFWDESNHQGLCASCHSQKTAKENQLARSHD